MKKTTLLGIGLGMLFLLLCMGGKEVLAAESNPLRQDGTGIKYHGEIDEDFYENVSPYAISRIALPQRSGNYTVRKGIDVSHYQNDKGAINWNQVKNSGVEFVIVKVGGRYNDATMYEDKNFRENIQGALAAGLRVGVYFWSEAVTEQEAIEEADYVISRINQYNITLPICMDYEWCGGDSAPHCRLAFLRNLGQTKEQRTAIANAFCNRCKEWGYTGMLYANKATLEGYFNGADLSGKVWVAQYRYQTGTEVYHDYANVTSTYSGSHDFYQFTSQGRCVSGIVPDVDLDYWYDDGTIYGSDYAAVFDAAYYANRYPDLKAAYGNNATALLEHFVYCGMAEGRQGSAAFDVRSYRLQYPDLRRAFGNDLKQYYLHYMRAGKAEGRQGTGCSVMQGAITTYFGRDYSAVYDYNYYINRYPDIKAAYGDDDEAVLAHFVWFGRNEGRQAKATFNVQSYRNLYPDLRQAYKGQGLYAYYDHYMQFGQREGRVTTGYENKLMGATTTYFGRDYSAVYDYDYYLAHNPDVRAAYGGDEDETLAHFVWFGRNEGRQAKATFNVQSYRNLYPDLRQAYKGQGLYAYYDHYMQFGQREGRVTTGYENKLMGATTTYFGRDYSAVYDYDYYLAHNPDVRAAYGGDEDETLAHFVWFGRNEGRQAKATFNVQSYQNRYPDLQEAYKGQQLYTLFDHYMQFGLREGRTAI